MKQIKLKIILILVFAILTVIFALQNTEIVTVEFYFWDINMPRALLILFSFALGLIIGLFLTAFSKNKKEKAKINHKDKETENISK